MPARQSAPRLLLLAIIVWLVGLPVLAVLWGAVHAGGAGDAGFTLHYLARVFASHAYVVPLANSARLALLVALCATLIGTGLAFATVRGRPWGQPGWEAAAMVPAFISPFIGAIGWVTLAQPRTGMLNAVLRAAGLPELDIFTWSGTVLTMALFFAPFAYGLIAAPLARLDPAMEEAAEICGASQWSRLRGIVLPMLWPAILSAAVFTFALAAEMYSIPAILLVPQGNPVLADSIFRRTVRWPVDYSEAAAAGLLLLLVTLASMMLYAWAVRRQERFVAVGARAAREQAPVPAWLRMLATIGCVLYVVLSVVLPLLAILLRALLPFFSGSFSLAQLSLGPIDDALGDELVLRSLGHSLIVGVVATSLLLVLAYAVALGRVRHPGWISRLTAFIAGLPLAIPGVLIGVGLLWFYIGTPAYGSLVIIILVMLARFLPILVRQFETSLMQLARELEEAAAISGASAFGITRHVRLPLMARTIRLAGILGGAQVVNELTASALLFTTGSSVLPVVVFNYMFDGDYPRACAVALLQVAILTIGAAVVLGVRRR